MTSPSVPPDADPGNWGQSRNESISRNASVTAHAAAAPATAASVDPAYRANVVAIAQLWADQFQHLTTLAVSGAGGLLILLQVELVKAGPKWWATLGLFALAALMAMTGQATVVDEATKGITPGRSARVIRGLVFATFGSASYWFVRLFV